MTNGELRGTIALLAILLLVLAIRWYMADWRTADTSGHSKISYFDNDSALIEERATQQIRKQLSEKEDRCRISQKKKKNHGRKTHRGKDTTNLKKQKLPIPDRDSPLDSPITP